MEESKKKREANKESGKRGKRKAEKQVVEGNATESGKSQRVSDPQREGSATSKPSEHEIIHEPAAASLRPCSHCGGGGGGGGGGKAFCSVQGPLPWLTAWLPLPPAQFPQMRRGLLLGPAVAAPRRRPLNLKLQFQERSLRRQSLSELKTRSAHVNESPKGPASARARILPSDFCT